MTSTLTAVRTAPPQDLPWLVRRIAAGDRYALAALHTAHLTALDQLPPGVAATVTAATLVEVWTMARFHLDGDPAAWIRQVAARRAGEHPDDGSAAVEDEGAVLALNRLLHPPAGVSVPPCRDDRI